MIPDVTLHPDYPFRDDRRAAVQARTTRFVDGPSSGAPEAAVLRDFLELAGAFAFLERIVQGEVLCDLPVHLGHVWSSTPGDPEEDGERLAEAEADLLDWTAGSIDSLADTVDGLGVKVFLLADAEPEETAAATEPLGSSRRGGAVGRSDGTGRGGADGRSGGTDLDGAAVPLGGPAGREIFGAFSFDSDVGPAILVGADAKSPEAAFVLAHEFGHLVADVDPYRSRFCRWDERSLSPRTTRPEETRADRFARALLMPARNLLRTMEEMGPLGPGGEAERVELLAAVYSVPAVLVRRRLADLGVLLADRDSPVARGVEARGGEVQAALPFSFPASPLPLPERYMNLALAAYGSRVLTPEILGRFLRTTEGEALRLADWAGVHPESRANEEEP